MHNSFQFKIETEKLLKGNSDMTDYVYIRVPFYIPKYWALKGQYDERLSFAFKYEKPKETDR